MKWGHTIVKEKSPRKPTNRNKSKLTEYLKHRIINFVKALVKFEESS